MSVPARVSSSVFFSNKSSKPLVVGEPVGRSIVIVDNITVVIIALVTLLKSFHPSAYLLALVIGRYYIALTGVVVSRHRRRVNKEAFDELTDNNDEI